MRVRDERLLAFASFTISHVLSWIHLAAAFCANTFNSQPSKLKARQRSLLCKGFVTEPISCESAA